MYDPIFAPEADNTTYTREQRQQWRTPNTPSHPVIHLCHQVMGDFTLDPTADRARSVPAAHHITELDDCLSPHTSWPTVEGVHKIFMNPPFDKPHLFLSRLVHEMDKGGPESEAIVLLKIGTLANKGTGTIIRSCFDSICVWGAGYNKRMAFIDHRGFIKSGADFDTVLIYKGPNAKRFYEVFQHQGTVMGINCYT